MNRLFFDLTSFTLLRAWLPNRFEHAVGEHADRQWSWIVPQRSILGLVGVGLASLFLSGCEERPLPPVMKYESAEVDQLRETLGMPAVEKPAESPSDSTAEDSTTAEQE